MSAPRTTRRRLRAAAPALVAAALLAAARPLQEPASGPEPSSPQRIGSVAAARYSRTPLRGFDVRVQPALLSDGDEAALGELALDALERDLGDLLDQTPKSAHAFLRSVPVYLGVSDPVALCACYHPSATWLERNGFDPAKARSVEIANAQTFLDWRRAQPSMVLHELAHAYLDQVAPDERPRLEAALASVRERGVYDRTLRWSGQVDRHYAITNVEEYFAETTEALLGVNDFYPFVRAELLVVDPEGAALVDEIWGLAAPGTGEADVVELATREVESLHSFFGEWFRGSIEDTDEAYSRFADAMGSSFRMITPDGRAKDRDLILADVRRRYGSSPGAVVSAAVLQVRKLGAMHVLVVYEELQERGDGTRRRLISTALMERNPTAPGGLTWLHLQETARGGPR